MRKSFILFILSALFILPACGYSPKSSLAPNLKTVCVTAFVNKINLQMSKPSAYVPLLEVKAHDAVVNEFLFNGTLRIAPEKVADLVLKGELIAYDRSALRYLDNDDVQQYRIRVTLHLTMLDDKGQVLWDEPNFSGEATYFLTGPTASSENDAVQQAVDDFAKRLVERTVEDW